MDQPFFVKIPLQANSSDPTPFEIVRTASGDRGAMYLGPFPSDAKAVDIAAKAAKEINYNFANSDLDWATAVRTVVSQQYTDVLVSIGADT